MCKLCMFLIKSDPFNSSSPPPSTYYTTCHLLFTCHMIYNPNREGKQPQYVQKKENLHGRHEYALVANTFQIHLLKARLFILTSLLLEMPLRAPPSLTAWSWCSDRIHNTHLRCREPAKPVSKPPLKGNHNSG